MADRGGSITESTLSDAASRVGSELASLAAAGSSASQALAAQALENVLLHQAAAQQLHVSATCVYLLVYRAYIWVCVCYNKMHTAGHTTTTTATTTTWPPQSAAAGLAAAGQELLDTSRLLAPHLEAVAAQAASAARLRAQVERLATVTGGGGAGMHQLMDSVAGGAKNKTLDQSLSQQQPPQQQQ
jgi:hypothetical protein